jgi:hypothetical protein
MGLYPADNASNSTNHLSEGEIRSILDDRGMPPMKVRRAAKHKEQAEKVTLEASIDGFQMIPVYSYIPNSIYDYVNQHGCGYVDQCIQTQITDPKFYVA